MKKTKNDDKRKFTDYLWEIFGRTVCVIVVVAGYLQMARSDDLAIVKDSMPLINIVAGIVVTFIVGEPLLRIKGALDKINPAIRYPIYALLLTMPFMTTIILVLLASVFLAVIGQSG